MAITIKETSIEKVYFLSTQIPEFIEPYPIEEYQKRLKKVNHLALGAFEGTNLIGFKVGYELNKSVFYSWMGAIAPNYRRQNIAKQLAQVQEKWAKEQGYKTIRFKTRNKLRSMIIFAIKNDFNIIDIEPRMDIGENRIVMEKGL